MPGDTRLRLGSPRPVFDPEAQTRRELGTKAAERRERDKARKRTRQVVEPFVRAERCRFGPAPHSLGEVG